MRNLMVAFFLLMSVEVASAQEEVIFENLSLQEGLSQTTVRAIIMDSTGYMWFGTEGGLDRYDGYRFKTYRKRWGRDDGLSDNLVTSLAEDNDGNIWIGTKGGLDRLEKDTDIIEHYVHDPEDERSLADDDVTSLCFDGSGNLWIGTKKGLERLTPGEIGFENQKYQPGAPLEKINVIETGRKECIWIGTDRALYRRDDSGFSSYVIPARFDADKAVTAIEEDHRKRIWIGTGSGRLYRLDTKNWKFSHVDLPTEKEGTPSPITSLYEDIVGELWIGTDGNGVVRFNPDSGTFATYGGDPSVQGLGGKVVLSICGDTGSSIYFGDLTGIIWMGTFSDGVEKVHLKKPFQRYDSRSYNVKSLAGQDIRALWKDEDGTLWAGTYGEGLRVVDEKNGVVGTIRHRPKDPSSIASDRILSIARDRKGELMIGTDRGLNRFDGNVFEPIAFIGRKNAPTVACMTTDGMGTVWIGTEQGLFRMQGSKAVPEKDSGELEGHDIISMKWDRGTLWIGTDDDGLFGLSEDGSCAHISPGSKDGVISRRILSIMPDEKGIWVGTDLGLQRLSKDGTRIYTSENGLPSDVIKAVLTDRYHCLWLSTDNGLCRLDPETGETRNYSMGDGLQGKEFNRGAATIDGFGKLYFGGTKGCNSFYPDNIYENEHVPPVVINEISVFGKPVSTTKGPGGYEKIALNYRQNYVTIGFAALDYTAPEYNEYMYRLEGFDENWIKAGNRHYAAYTNIPPGRYLFSVRGANNNGVWNDDEAKLEIEVTPPLWRTPLAYASYALSLILLCYFFFVYVRNKQEKETEKRLRLVMEVSNRKLTEKNDELEQARRDETQHRQRLRSLATALTEAEERERRKIAAEVHDSIGQTLALSKIRLEMMRESLKGLAEDDISGITDMLDESIRSTRTLTFELGTPMLYRFGFESALDYLSERFDEDYGMTIRTVSENAIPPMDDDMKAFLFRAVRELAMNAVKHSGASILTIRIKTVDDRLYVSVTDDGSGFDTKSLERLEGNRRSFGLFSLSERIISLGGRMVIRSVPGEGTSVRLLVPIGRRESDDDHNDTAGRRSQDTP